MNSAAISKATPRTKSRAAPYLCSSLRKAKGAGKAGNQKQSHAHPAEEGEVCCIPQKLRSPAQTREVRFEVNAVAIIVGDVVQAANTVDDSGQPPEHDRDEAGNGSQNESWRHGPRVGPHTGHFNPGRSTLSKCTPEPPPVLDRCFLAWRYGHDHLSEAGLGQTTDLVFDLPLGAGETGAG